MIRRRRCGRYCFNRFIVILMAFISTVSTVSWSYHYFSETLTKNFDTNQPIYYVDDIDLKDAQSPITNDIRLFSRDRFNMTQIECQYPKLALDSRDVWLHLDPVPHTRPECEKSTNWVYVENGTLRLSSQALRKHGAIVCAYRPILRSKDDFSTMEGARLFPIVDRMPLVSDFFRADCRARDGSFYSNIHSGIMFDAGLHMR